MKGKRADSGPLGRGGPRSTWPETRGPPAGCGPSPAAAPRAKQQPCRPSRGGVGPPGLPAAPAASGGRRPRQSDVQPPVGPALWGELCLDPEPVLGPAWREDGQCVCCPGAARSRGSCVLVRVLWPPPPGGLIGSPRSPSRHRGPGGNVKQKLPDPAETVCSALPAALPASPGSGPCRGTACGVPTCMAATLGLGLAVRPPGVSPWSRPAWARSPGVCGLVDAGGVLTCLLCLIFSQTRTRRRLQWSPWIRSLSALVRRG